MSEQTSNGHQVMPAPELTVNDALPHHIQFAGQQGGRAYYTVGTGYRIHQRPHDDLKEPPLDEKETLEYVRKVSELSIPVPFIANCWIDEHTPYGPTYFTLRRHIHGEPLMNQWAPGSLWHKSTLPKRDIIEQIHVYLRKLRTMQARFMGRIGTVDSDDGTIVIAPEPLVDDALFNAGALGLVREGPFTSDWEFWNAIAKYMSHLPGVTPAVLDQLGSQMPCCEPFTFTHASLDPSNFLLAENNEVVGMLDWERAGFFPVWWEYVRLAWFSQTRADEFPRDWCQLLFEGMDQYPEAWEWYKKVRNLWYLGHEHCSTEQKERARNTLGELS
ncbi:hypothetical protein EX30DRAFT_69845 [Ascodesmis nigricans]|uniref:Aminoglycoside phosphotransferase domain-containing protein n=1 Tax=Ascodesmis nigricans TaxID=341454 RepID=A0A4S2MTK5_9PEZI|nr:hypothetical protein EX30DRAFT_69845 [Ascodesmis nigricans]